MYLLDQTPSEVIIAVMLLLTTYAAHKGLPGMVHLNLLFMPIILLVVVAILIFNTPDFNVESLRPVLAEGIAPVLLALKIPLFAFLGVEVLFFIMANVNQADLRSLPLNLTVAVITLIYMLVTVFSYSIFTLDATKFITFPMIELAKEIEVPGAFFERLESLIMTVWIMAIFNTMTICHYLTYFILKDHFFAGERDSFRRIKQILPSLIQLAAFFIAFLPNSLTETFTLSDWSGWLGGFNVLSGLGLGYLTVWIRKRNQKTEL